MKAYEIRAHHGMCLAFFEGKGYSEEFVKNMAVTKKELQDNPDICLVAHVDRICAFCPNNSNGICKSEEKINIYDHKVLQLCGIKAGSNIKWKEYEHLVEEKILKAGKREEVCGDCNWNELCKSSS